MQQQQKLIIIAGAVGAYFILRGRTVNAQGGKVGAGKGGLLSTLLPTRGTNSPYVATTNMATRGGVAQPRVPSSGLGYGTSARGVAQAPTTIGAIAQGSGSALQGLFGYLASRARATNPAAPRTAAQAAQAARQASSGGTSGGSSGGSSGGANGQRSAGLGGAANLANQTYSNGYFDDNGAWHGYDGYYDDNGQFIPTTAEGYLEGNDNGGAGLVATVPDVSPQNADLLADARSGLDTSGAVDENGNWDPSLDPGVEVLYDDPDQPAGPLLDSTPIGNGLFDAGAAPGDGGNTSIDPATSDWAGPIDGGADDQQWGTIDVADNGGGPAQSGGGEPSMGDDWWGDE